MNDTIDKSLRLKIQNLGGEVLAWGRSIVIEYKSEATRSTIIQQLTREGWHLESSEDDDNAGILSFSLTPTPQCFHFANAEEVESPWKERGSFLIMTILSCSAIAVAWETYSRATVVVLFLGGVFFLFRTLQAFTWKMVLAPDCIRVSSILGTTEIWIRDVRSIRTEYRRRFEEAIVFGLATGEDFETRSLPYSFARSVRDEIRRRYKLAYTRKHADA